ncbi:MAG: hypothetical protein Q7K65_03595 [Candidatus Buchananbacteria bacterium]|nr:hypothetical protein [Candidatus Buchananbacteria bacterium]
MRKQIVCLVLIAVLALAGCPTAPVNQVPDSSIPAGFGQVTVQGDLNATKSLIQVSADKADTGTAINWNSIVDHLKPQITTMQFSFWPANVPVPIPTEDSTNKGGDSGGGGGGGGMGGQDFVIDVVDGVFQGSFLIRPGAYDVYVSAYGQDGILYFYANSYIEVGLGMSSTLQVVFQLTNYLQFRFVVDGLPGEYGDFGQASIIDGDNDYYADYYRWYDWYGNSSIVFSAYLPIDFSGSLDESAVIAQDANDKYYASGLAFSVFDVTGDGPMHIPYAPVNWLGEIDVDIDFQVY